MLCVDRLPNMHLEIMLHLMAPDTDYPFPWAQSILRRLMTEVGPESICWGSDFPACERSCSYTMAMDWVRKSCGGWMGPREQALFFGGNVARVFGL